MAKPKERIPADFVRVPASDEQLLGLWAKVERGAERRRARVRNLRRGAASGALVAVLAGALALTWSREPAPVASIQPAIDSTGELSEPIARPADPSGETEAPRQLALADGSHLSLGAGARARVLVMRTDEVRVRLDRGEVECDVQPARERRFIVEAGAFEVVVTGTRFSVVAHDHAAPASIATPGTAPAPSGSRASSVAVSVERGSVEVREPSGRLLAALAAGQRWASESSARAEPDAGPARGPAAAEPEPRPSARPRTAQPASAPSTSASSSLGGAAPRLDPSALLARASEARLAGKLHEAAAALEELIRKYPDDERAGYAAFLLGRIQLDGLSDARAAVRAFSFAVAHPGSGFFVEDAEARQIEALARSGQTAECARARDHFLAKYPRAARAASVRDACREK